MKTVKIYLCAGLFILLTALKLLLPGQAMALRQYVRELVERDDDYSQMVAALGQRLTESDPVNGLIEAFRGEGNLLPWEKTPADQPVAAESRP